MNTKYKFRKYKFRSECISDIMDFLSLTRGYDIGFTIEFNNQNLPDCECTLETLASLEEIKELFDSMLDSHVMQETLALEEEYTGIRR